MRQCRLETASKDSDFSVRLVKLGVSKGSVRAACQVRCWVTLLGELPEDLTDPCSHGHQPVLKIPGVNYPLAGRRWSSMAWACPPSFCTEWREEAGRSRGGGGGGRHR